MKNNEFCMILLLFLIYYLFFNEKELFRNRIMIGSYPRKKNTAWNLLHGGLFYR